MPGDLVLVFALGEEPAHLLQTPLIRICGRKVLQPHPKRLLLLAFHLNIGHCYVVHTQIRPQLLSHPPVVSDPAMPQIQMDLQASRLAAEGLVGIAASQHKATIVEVLFHKMASHYATQLLAGAA